jgi:DNA-binding transcriptional regulator YdaS (Cro superfamily)
MGENKMARLVTPQSEKPADLVQAEQAANAALRTYFRRDVGVQASVARATGIKPPVLSRMSNQPGYPISLEQAILIEVATNGELQAPALCPSRATLLAQFMRMHGTATT